MKNMPELKIGVVAVSRDCFPEKRGFDKSIQGKIWG